MLYSIKDFWCKQFLLSKGVLKRLIQLCLNFFWKGKGARVRWQDVCLPKIDGELGLKDIVNWNKACMMQHIWSILAKSGSIWIAWVNAYKLKG